MVNDQDIYIVPLQKQTNHCSVLKSTSGKSQYSPAIWITKASEDSKENTYMLMHLCTRFKTINASKYCKRLDGLTMHMLVIWIGFATSVLGASLLLFLLLRDSEDMPYILPLRSKGSVAFGLGRCKCFPTLTFHTSWSTLRWKIVTAVTEERLCGETTWFHEFETMITRNREDLNSKTRNLLEQSGSGMLESKWYLVPKRSFPFQYWIYTCSLKSNRKISFFEEGPFTLRSKQMLMQLFRNNDCLQIF